MWIKLRNAMDTTRSRSCSFDSGDSCVRTSGKKRQADEMSGDSDSSSPKTKKPIMPSTKIKREREKLRRIELSDELDNLSELVFRIDPVLTSGREECFGLKDAQPKKQTSRTNNVTNRTELVKSSIRLIEKLHDEGKEKDRKIEGLKLQLLSLTQHQPAVPDATASKLFSAQSRSPHPLLHSSNCITSGSYASAPISPYLAAASQGEHARPEADANHKQASFIPSSFASSSSNLPVHLVSNPMIHSNHLNQINYSATHHLGTISGDVSSFLQREQREQYAQALIGLGEIEKACKKHKGKEWLKYLLHILRVAEWKEVEICYIHF